ncbi:MAG: pyridoxal-phosphate dependent enzyme [Sandaracinaceae bacterium]|nr:pyridoxal-phosphate dependent enzyme [Sandaracinaceae bacterium]
MRAPAKSILEAVGATPLVRLNKIGADLGAELYAKCEFLSPSGSSKDRMACALVDAAAASGALSPGGTIVEATTGNTGAALALVAAVRGYKCVCVVPDKIGPEKIAALRAYGARVVVAPSAVEPDDPRSMRSVARRLASGTPNAWLVNQFDSTEGPAAYAASLGPELWEQTGGAIDAVVVGIGSGATAMGLSRYLKAQRPDVAVVGVEPRGSIFAELAASGRVTHPSAYQLEGIGADFVPRILELSRVDAVVQVEDGEAFRTTRDLVRLEGLGVGGSSGAVVAGALAWARARGGSPRVVAILPDRASGYLSKIFDDAWMRENGFLEDDEGLGTVRELLRVKGNESVITAKAHDRVRDVVARIKAHGISQLPVMQGDELLGVVSEVDLLRYLVSGESSLEGAVEPLVESHYATATPDTRIEVLQATLADAGVAIVVDAGRVVGIVTKIDLIDYLTKRSG